MTFLDDRRRGVEEAFFAKQNEQLRLQLRSGPQSGAPRDQLAQASGLRSAKVLDSLVDNKVSPEGAAALSLIPLVAVAWADGEVSAKEREALLAAAQQAGLEADNASYRLFAGWLDDEPPASLMENWKHYAGALLQDMTPGAAMDFRDEVLGRARAVASAAGGFLGIGRISAAEEAVLGEIQATLEA